MGEILSFEELQKHKYINMECYHPPTSHLPRDLIVLYCMTLNLSYPVRMEGGQGRALAYRATYRALARSLRKARSSSSPPARHILPISEPLRSAVPDPEPASARRGRHQPWSPG